MGPPHILKQRMVLEFAKSYHTDILIETGTFLGDMIYALKDKFKTIYSIELSPELHNRAKHAFRKYPHIHLIEGNSATALAGILANVKDRCIFWLDGHYSGGDTAMADQRCPIRGELDAIIRHPIKDHVILIDDAACFDGRDGYPTLSELHEILVSNFPGYQLRVFDNIIQLLPAVK